MIRPSHESEFSLFWKLANATGMSTRNSSVNEYPCSKKVRASGGFTLIELLVVISVIALLSSVVLSALNTARIKAADNAVKTVMKQIANQAEIYRDLNSNFGVSAQSGVVSCNQGLFSDPRILQMQANIIVNTAPGATFVCYTDSTRAKWAISVSPLRGSSGPWCIDNSSAFRASIAQNTGICS